MKCATCGTPFDPDVSTTVFKHEATHDVPLHTVERCLDAINARYKLILDAMLPSAQLVWAQGGWSGSSGNYSLVEAYDKVVALEKTCPDVYDLIKKR